MVAVSFCEFSSCEVSLLFLTSGGVSFVGVRWFAFSYRGLGSVPVN